MQRCEEIYLNKVKSSKPLYLSWKALKEGSMKMKGEAMEGVFASHTPRKCRKKEKKVREEGSRQAWGILTQYLRNGRI